MASKSVVPGRPYLFALAVLITDSRSKFGLGGRLGFQPLLVLAQARTSRTIARAPTASA